MIDDKFSMVTQLKIEFLRLIQAKQYEQGKSIADKIITLDPENKVIKKFFALIDNFQDQKIPTLHSQKDSSDCIKIDDKQQKLIEEENENEDEGDYESEEDDDEQDEKKEADEKEEQDEKDEAGENEQSIEDEEKEMGYGYYDENNPSYNQEEYLLQKKQFLSNFKDQNELSTNILQAQSSSLKTKEIIVKPKVSSTLNKAQSQTQIKQECRKNYQKK